MTWFPKKIFPLVLSTSLVLQNIQSFLSILFFICNWCGWYSICGNKRIHSGVEVLQQEEGGNDDQDQEESVVVEDGEGGGLVVSNLILLPEDPKWTRDKKIHFNINLVCILFSWLTRGRHFTYRLNVGTPKTYMRNPRIFTDTFLKLSGKHSARHFLSVFHLSSFSLRDILRLSASDNFLVTSLETASSRFWATLEKSYKS